MIQHFNASRLPQKLLNCSVVVAQTRRFDPIIQKNLKHCCDVDFELCTSIRVLLRYDRKMHVANAYSSSSHITVSHEYCMELHIAIVYCFTYYVASYGRKQIALFAPRPLSTSSTPRTNRNGNIKWCLMPMFSSFVMCFSKFVMMNGWYFIVASFISK